VSDLLQQWLRWQRKKRRAPVSSLKFTTAAAAAGSTWVAHTVCSLTDPESFAAVYISETASANETVAHVRQQWGACCTEIVSPRTHKIVSRRFYKLRWKTRIIHSHFGWFRKWSKSKNNLKLSEFCDISIFK